MFKQWLQLQFSSLRFLLKFFVFLFEFHKGHIKVRIVSGLIKFNQLQSLFKLVDNRVLFHNSRNSSFLKLSELLLHLLVWSFQLFVIALELWNPDFFILLRFKQLEHLVFFDFQLLVEFVHDFLELLFFILIPDGALVFFLKQVGSSAFVVQLGSGLMIE